MNKIVDISKCGLVRNPYKKVTCKNDILPYCPGNLKRSNFEWNNLLKFYFSDLIEGLWGNDYDSTGFYSYGKNRVKGCNKLMNFYQLMYVPKKNDPNELGFKGIPCKRYLVLKNLLKSKIRFKM